MPNKIIKILHLEDNADDAVLVRRAMGHETNFEWHWASNKEDYLKELDNYFPDIILSDHSLTNYDSEEAFNLTKERGLNIPFILVTGTISEEFAVTMMKKGVSDYLLKDRIQRLPASIAQAMAKLRAAREKEIHQEAIARNEANLTAIIENSDAHIYSLDKNFRYITFNSLLKDKLKETYGLDIHEGDLIYGFLNKLEPEEAKEWEARYQRAFSGQSLQFIKEFNVEGVHTFTSFSINPIKEGDKIQGLSCFVRDITEQSLAEEKTKQSEARFRALIENNYDAIILRDENLNIMYRSPSANKMLGYPSEDLHHAGFFDDVHTDDIDYLKKCFKEVKANPGKSFHLIVRVRHKNGHYIWVEGSMRNMLANENVKGIIFNYRDISERKESELQREKMIADITLRIRDLEQFAYIVSHNLRAPVANILGISNILNYDGLDQHEKQAAMSGITSSAQKLDDVIKDLNNILQMKGQITENRQMVSFQVLIDDIRSSIAQLIKDVDVKIEVDFTAVEGIQSIKSYLYSIFYNLISNSIKYKKVNLPLVILIKSNKIKDSTVLLFRDNGIGIDLEKQGSKVFGLYKRFHPETEGKGMGLFMVKTQVETLGGSISIKSAVNEGTEFTITL